MAIEAAGVFSAFLHFFRFLAGQVKLLFTSPRRVANRTNYPYVGHY